MKNFQASLVRCIDRYGGRSLRAFSIGILVFHLGTAKAQLVVPAGAVFQVPTDASLNLGCTPLQVQGSLLLGTGQIALARDVTIGTTGTLSAGAGTLTVGGNWSNNGAFMAGSGTVRFVDTCNASPISFAGTTVFNNLILSSTNGGAFTFPAGGSVTVNGTLTLLGAAGNPVRIIAPAGQAGSTVISLGPNAQVVSTNASVSPNIQIGGANVIANLPENIRSIPTLSEWGMLLLGLIFVGLAHKSLPVTSRATSRNA